MASFVATYVVILLQFQISEIPTDDIDSVNNATNITNGLKLTK